MQGKSSISEAKEIRKLFMYFIGFTYTSQAFYGRLYAKYMRISRADS